MASTPFRRLLHWGPLSVFGIIKLITWAMVHLLGMWWPPHSSLAAALHAALFLTLAGSTLYFFLQSLLEGPGFVPLGWKPENEEDTHNLQFCTVCNGFKAPRSHHCRKCGYCVKKMDHHCPWINCCVGHNNHGYFTLFLISAVLGCFHASVRDTEQIKKVRRALWAGHARRGFEQMLITALTGQQSRSCFDSVPDPPIRKLWIETTGRIDWIPTKCSTICSQHFDDENYITTKSGKKNLRPGAYPHKYIVMCSSSSLPCTSDTVTKTASTNDITQGASNAEGKTCQNMPNVDDHKPTPSTPRRIKSINPRSIQAQELTRRMVTKKSGGKCKQKYSPALRTFALTLHYYSPKAYDYIRRTFDTCLPERRTLRKWYEKIGGDPGFTKESFEALKQKSKNTNFTIIAGLAIDEMAIRRRIEYDGEKLVGHVDIGTGVEGDHVLEAKEALVFLVTSINCNFKVPVGYFLVDGITGSQRSDLILQCLELIHETGIRIISLTFDGCAANIAMVKCLGCSIEDRRITFNHPVTKDPILVLTICMYHAINRVWYVHNGTGREPMIYLTLTTLLLTLLAIGMAVGVVLAVGVLLYLQLRGIFRNQTTIEDWIVEKAQGRREEQGLPEFVFPYNLGWRNNVQLILQGSKFDGIKWPLREGCGEYDLTREQQAQKQDKRVRSRQYRAVSAYSGRWLPASRPRAACAAPCTDEPRLPLQPGDLIRATRQRKHWLFGEKLVGDGENTRGPRGWFPRDAAVPCDYLHKPKPD
ncbi:hypothetical protein HW555_007407 [Spodoptera exigua]|uniref:Palmitoyltransferase n=1 Tax=Spodoptera exigua TaxID=7107 RepID=A0A835L8Y4_SPOEX|nr:hypothetical protein HW555_007407 [Spodoptera exigua]